MHRHTRHEVRSQLPRYELPRHELGRVRAPRTLDCLLRRQLRELLCDQVVILSKLLQQELLMQQMLLMRQHCRIALLRAKLLRLPCSPGLSGAIGQTVQSIHPRRLAHRELLRRQLMRQKLLNRMLLQSSLLRISVLPELRLSVMRIPEGNVENIVRIAVQANEGSALGAEVCLGIEVTLGIEVLGIETTLRMEHIYLRLEHIKKMV